MHQSTSSSSSFIPSLKAIADVEMASRSAISASKPLSSENGDNSCPARRAERCESDGEKAPDRLDAPLKTPQAWEPELPELPDFDVTASPGAEEWQTSETADGRAVYSTASSAGVAVTVEFQKWDW